MSKNKFRDQQKSEITENPVESIKIIVENTEPPIDKKPVNKSPIFINAIFSEEIIEIGYTFLATGEQNILSVSNGRIHMLQGRMYYIPIGREDIDSDNYNIKVHSDIADRFDVRYIKNGLAAVVPIRHNCILKNGERLCVLTLL